MRQSSGRKRARRLLRRLKLLQEDDHEITSPTIFAMKYLLQLHNRCKSIEVKIDCCRENYPYPVDRFLLPKFIVSQLEEQRLTSRDSDTVQLPGLVGFVIQALPRAGGSSKVHPTLFRWHDPLRHRTYYVFAYIPLTMARRTYTLTELMGFRPTQDPTAQVMAVSRNNDLGKLNIFFHCMIFP